MEEKGAEGAGAAVLPDVSSSEDEATSNANRWGDSGVSDFDAMLAKKKSEQTKRRKRRDIDIINDNDDLIEGLLVEMKNAAEVSVCSYFFKSYIL